VVGNAGGDEAIDLYSGVGLFSLPLSKRFRSVSAIERGASAFRDLEWNAAQNGTNVRVEKASAIEFLASVQQTLDLVVADPPRAGLGPEVTAELLRVMPGNLILVSCDPATMARDLKKLLAAYRVERLTLIDLFPQTYHFETIVHLERNAA
jgi:23S rRNA (uracil1939-C5)-methyltransferase